MFQYRQVLVRLRQGDSDRDIARSRLMGRGACQGSCRLSYVAEAVSFSSASAALTTDSRSGLSVTAPMGCQLRVCRAQRRGLAARASRYSACRRARML